MGSVAVPSQNPSLYLLTLLALLSKHFEARQAKLANKECVSLGPSARSYPRLYSDHSFVCIWK